MIAMILRRPCAAATVAAALTLAVVPAHAESVQRVDVENDAPATAALSESIATADRIVTLVPEPNLGLVLLCTWVAVLSRRRVRVR